MTKGEGSDVPTQISQNSFPVSNATIIRFNSPPTYRNNLVDLKNGNILLLHGISRLTGQNQGGVRARVTHLEQKTHRCEVDLTNSDYEVEVGYFGYVNEGIEN